MTSEIFRNLRSSFRSKMIGLTPCVVLLGCSLAAAQEHAKVAVEVPHLMSECEGQDNATCGTWTFEGTEGTGQWRSGALANLTVQQFDPGWVIIRRSDPSGASPGLTAIYVGKIQGQRVEGTVTWRWLGHWTQEAQGTWFATFGEPGSNDPTPSPPRSTPQIDPGLPANAGEETKQNTGQPPGGAALSPNVELPRQTEICTSRRIEGVMQSLELAVIQDPNGAFLSLLVGSLTGVSARSHGVQIVGSGNGTDNGLYTSKDPGSFVCRGFFIHKEVEIEETPDADGLSGITAEYMKDLMANNPVYIEWFKVEPLENGHYVLSLLPSSIPLSREYEKEFTYP